MRALVIAGLALATAACGTGSQNNAAPAAETGNIPESAGNQVAALSEGQRNGVFIRAIRDAGLECQGVERSVPAGDYQGQPVWRATCQGGGEWTIVIGADGTAQILPQGTTVSGNQTAPLGNRQQ